MQDRRRPDTSELNQPAGQADEKEALPIVVGLSHRTASADVRGLLSINTDEISTINAILAHTPGVSECAVLSTCNRTEIYAFAAGEAVASRLLQRISEWRQLDAEELHPYLYILEGEDCVSHLFRVASGLDSMVVGEAQILGQVKRAFAQARAYGAAAARLSRLSEHAVASAKNVRNQTGIGGCPVSLAGAAAEQVKKAVEDASHATALVIGAGENAELITHHLTVRGASRIWIANRTPERARRLASLYNAAAVDLEDIDDLLTHVDVVVTSTGSNQPILDAGRIQRALDARNGRDLILLDLAIPRDIEVGAGDLPGIHLYSADDLGRLARENIRVRRESAKKAADIVTQEVQGYFKWLQERQSVPAIRALRARAEEHRQEALGRALKKLRNGMSPEEALDYLSYHLKARLLHTPTRALLRATQEDEDGITIETLAHLLDIENQG